MILSITERLIIREYEDSDADSIVRIVNNEGIYRTTYAIPRDYTKKRAKWWIKYLRSTAKNKTGFEYGMFMKESGEYVGNIGIINISLSHNRGDITYFVDPNLWGKGFATEGGKVMLKLAFENMKLNRLWMVGSSTPASCSRRRTSARAEARSNIPTPGSIRTSARSSAAPTARRPIALCWKTPASRWS